MASKKKLSEFEAWAVFTASQGLPLVYLGKPVSQQSIDNWVRRGLLRLENGRYVPTAEGHEALSRWSGGSSRDPSRYFMRGYGGETVLAGPAAHRRYDKRKNIHGGEIWSDKPSKRALLRESAKLRHLKLAWTRALASGEPQEAESAQRKYERAVQQSHEDRMVADRIAYERRQANRDPRKSAKFERCVHHVKRSSSGRTNAWAVCHASLNRKNGKRDPMLYDNVHSHEAQELVLYADNDHALYQQKDAFLQNAYRKMKKGTYSPTLAVKLWMYYVDRCAQKYAKEMGGGSAWHKMFPKPVREEAARYYAQSEAAKLHKGEYSKYPAL
jgi:hypothetical protein